MRMLYSIGIVTLGLLLGRHHPLAEPTPKFGGGLTELYRWDLETVNLVKNSSFEESNDAGKLAAWNMPLGRTLEWTDEEARTGKRSLLLRDSDTDRWSPAAIQSTELVPGWYSVSGWLKARNAGNNARGAGGRIDVHATKDRGSGASTPIVRGTTEWTRVEHQFPFAGGSAEIRLGPYRKPDGKIYFDDIELKRLILPLVEGFLLYPNYRGILFPEGSQKIRLSLRVRPEEAGLDLTEMRVEVSLVPEGGGAPALEQTTVPSSSKFVMELDAKDLFPGSYLLNLRAVRQQTGESLSRYPSHRIIKITAAERKRFKTYIDEDNALVLDDTRTFALGIYNTGGYSNSPEAYEPLASKIAEAPLNLYINYWLGGAPDRAISALTTALRRHNIHYLHTVNNWYEDREQWKRFPPCGTQSPEQMGEVNYVACRAGELESLPGFAGWYTADEAPATQVDRVFRQYRVLTSSAPDGITFVAQNRGHELEKWRDSADVFDLHRYPIFNTPEGELSPLETVYENTKAAVEAVEGSRPIWAVIQYFPHGGKGHWPTYDELRAMSYMAIVGGAKGLVYWSYGAKGLAWVKDPFQKEEIWQRLVRLTKEIKELEPALLEADVPGILSASSPIRVLCKRKGREISVVAVNFSPNDVKANFRLAEPARSISVVGEDREILVDPSAAYQDAFGPYGVHVYRIVTSQLGSLTGRHHSQARKRSQLPRVSDFRFAPDGTESHGVRC